MLDLRALLVCSALTAAGGFATGYQVARWQQDGKDLKALQTARADMVLLTGERDALTRELSAANDAHLLKLKEAQHETASLRDRLLAGTVRLRVSATCPAAPTTAADSSVDTGAGAELDATARRAYLALRDGIDLAAGQLSACQGELRLRR